MFKSTIDINKKELDLIKKNLNSLFFCCIFKKNFEISKNYFSCLSSE